MRTPAANKLTATTVRGLRTPGKFGDGGGLWLIVTTPERRAWVLRYMRQGRSREMSLGNVRDVTLAEARERAAEARRLLAQGMDPCWTTGKLPRAHRRPQRPA